MSNSRQIGRFYCLPKAGEFELHVEGGEVIAGRISDDLFIDALQQFNGTGVLCSCIVRGTPPVLLSIGAVR